MRVRRSFLEGTIALIALLLLSAALGSTALFPPSESHYLWLNADKVSESPSDFENMRISITVTISGENHDVLNNTFYVNEGFHIVIPNATDQIKPGAVLSIRGLCLIASQGKVLVEEWHLLDTWGPILRSVPGLVIFLLLFFSVFKIDFHSLSIRQRRF